MPPSTMTCRKNREPVWVTSPASAAQPASPFPQLRCRRSAQDSTLAVRGIVLREGQELFDAAHDLLRSPVRTRKYVRNGHVAEPLKHAGESALSDLTDLSPPPRDTFAIAASDWKTFGQTYELVEVDPEQAAHIIETWAYDPADLSDARTVDPLSLYTQFRNHRDERVSMAVERLLERIAW